MLTERRHPFLLTFCVALLCFGLTERAEAVETSATASILLEASSGRVLYEDSADKQMLIASTTKIMTAIVAVESGCDLNETVTVTQAHMAEGSSMYLQVGEEITLEALLYGLMLSSGNDAALAIADHCGPGLSAFVSKMNAKAKELGMSHTSFANPNGLDAEGHYSTARDMATLAAYAMENETFARIVSTKSVTIGGHTLYNHNKLLSRYEGCIGVKTGYTIAAGRTLVSCAERNGMRLIAVTLQDSDDWADHAALYDYGFEQYTLQTLATAGGVAAQIPVLNAGTTRVPLCYGEDFSYPLAAGEEIEMEWNGASCAFAPLAFGGSAGAVTFSLDGEALCTLALHYGVSAQPLSFK
jgi:D-alanyl-D-alanine carboxypeptidase